MIIFLRLFSSIALFFFSFCDPIFCYAAEEYPDENKAIYTLHCVGHYYNACKRNGSRDPDLNSSYYGPTVEKSLMWLFSQKIVAGNFTEASEMKNFLRRRIDVPGTVEDITRTAFNNLYSNFLDFERVHVQDTFLRLLDSFEFYKAQRLLESFRFFEDEFAGKVRERAVAKVENLARKISLLSGVAPDLEVEERTQAATIINSFPEGHELRTHLQERFDAILANLRTSVSDESQRTILRRMADRLFG